MHFKIFSAAARSLAVTVLILLSAAAPGLAHDAPAGQHLALSRAEADQEVLASGPAAGPALEFFPHGNLYAPYLADPNSLGFGLRIQHYTRKGIPNAGDTRFFLKTGGQFGLLWYQPRGADGPAWQLGLEAGFLSQFDIDQKLDNLGWDGRYGLVLTTARSKNLSFRLGYLHDSSHVGDEYAERNGRLRIGYTREELAAGVSWLSDNGMRTYAEYAHGLVLRSDDQKPGRVQIGLEWMPPKPGLTRYRGWYAAADLTAMQERDWKIDVGLQAGYRIDNTSRTWRFGLDWYAGRPPIGEFFRHTESYLGFGLWVDI